VISGHGYYANSEGRYVLSAMFNISSVTIRLMALATVGLSLMLAAEDAAPAMDPDRANSTSACKSSSTGSS
jgi:hypothetical protein